MFPTVPVMALTATATPRVKADVLKALRMETAEVFKQSFNRSNLYYEVRPKGKKTIEEIVKLAKTTYRGESGIVYCLSRTECEQMANNIDVSQRS
jgi:superfamily II DNA helicase RecQ